MRVLPQAFFLIIFEVQREKNNLKNNKEKKKKKLSNL
jgi:hypothetical protein